MRKFFPVILFLLALPATASAADEKSPPITVKAEINKAYITIGDPVEYSVTVKRDPSVQVVSSIQAPAADVLKIKKIDEIKRKEGSQLVEGRKFTLTAFRLGQFVLDPVTIEYRIADGAPQTIQTDAIYLTVKSVAEGKPQTDIRGVKGVINIPFRWTFVIVGVLVIILAIAGYLIYEHFKRRGAGEISPELKRTAEEEALLALNELFDSDMLRTGKVKLYFLRLSEILRTYLERRYEFLAVEFTTDEIRRSMKDLGIAQAHRDKIVKILESADLAKFAKWAPGPSEILRLNKQSVEFVEESRPAPVVEPQAEEKPHAV